MGNASKVLIDMGRKEGEIKGIVEMAIEYKKEDRNETVKRLMQKFKLSEKEAIEKYEEYSSVGK